jgi:hypothetical protein
MDEGVEAARFLQASGTPLPTGEMMPSPVTTTLRLAKCAPQNDKTQDLPWLLM